jgi:hypothetical protein
MAPRVMLLFICLCGEHDNVEQTELKHTSMSMFVIPFIEYFAFSIFADFSHPQNTAKNA